LNKSLKNKDRTLKARRKNWFQSIKKPSKNRLSKKEQSKGKKISLKEISSELSQMGLLKKK
jgi:hypothetical protein